MTGSSSPAVRALRLAVRALQLGLVVIAGYAVFVERNVGLVVNTILPLGVALLPVYVHWRHEYRLNPVLTLLIVGGAAFHSAGALGLYRSIGWFDQVAHGVAGALVGGIGYALVQVLETQYDRIHIPPELRFVFVVVFAVAIGVTWEIVEFGFERLSTVLGGEALLAQYGLADVVLDLQFDILGGIVIALWGTSYFDGLRAFLNSYLDQE